jgi:hypothetical protein
MEVLTFLRILEIHMLLPQAGDQEMLKFIYSWSLRLETRKFISPFSVGLPTSPSACFSCINTRQPLTKQKQAFVALNAHERSYQEIQEQY